MAGRFWATAEGIHTPWIKARLDESHSMPPKEAIRRGGPVISDSALQSPVLPIF